MELVTVLDVPTKSRRTTPPRSTQIDPGPWDRFGRVALFLGFSRAALMKLLVLWFIRWPGAKLPRRLTLAEMDALPPLPPEPRRRALLDEAEKREAQ